ncbi:hypothetical protein Syun_016397 [Stephania yunnanensis]|uniref:Uncharacterized protein n=1 Tax=Stephania yunnanensis TaxID=152371 RepID=A0AAP0P3V3_9MAGN
MGLSHKEVIMFMNGDYSDSGSGTGSSRGRAAEARALPQIKDNVKDIGRTQIREFRMNVLLELFSNSDAKPFKTRSEESVEDITEAFLAMP